MPPPVPPDAELVAACRAGDRGAFVEIVRRHQSLICAIAYNITGSVERSEDVAQDTFVRAWRRMEELREPEKLRGWLGKIASSLALNLAAREKRLVSEENMAEPRDSAPSPDEAAADGEDAALVWKTLETLPEPVRLPLILFYREGESVAAVAAALELSEDAVKQRLARGRAALRDKVEALTSSVLGRTKPGAVFTFAVLAAAGALAAPSAMAAAAFGGAAGASAAATGATAAASSAAPPISFFTVMTALKSTPALAAVLALAFLPVGYRLSEAATPAASSALDSGPRPVRTASALPDLNDSALVAEWRRLHAEHGASAADMPAIFQAIEAIKDPFRRRALRAALLAEWAELDAPAALAFCRARNNQNQTAQVMREWMTRDASAAVTALMSGPPGWQAVAKDLLPDIARGAPALLWSVVSQLPPPENFMFTEIRDACRLAAESDPEGAAREAVKLTGTNALEALAGAAGAWADRDPQGAWRWADALEGAGQKSAALREVLQRWARTDPVAALEKVKEVPPGTEGNVMNSDIGYQVLAAAAGKDLKVTLDWLRENPAKLGMASLYALRQPAAARLSADVTGTLEMFRHESIELQSLLSSFLHDQGFSRFGEVRDWLAAEGDSRFADEVRQGLIRSALETDTGLLTGLVDSMPPAQKTPEKMGIIADSLIARSVQDLASLDALLSRSPPELASALVKSALTGSKRWTDGDVTPWLPRLERLPEGEARAKGSATLAGVWAGDDPEAAARWAGGLADDAERARGMGAVAARWAEADSYETSRWISGLPTGGARDAAAGALVSVIAGEDPDSALIWAGSITDAEARRASVSLALEEWARRDGGQALRKLETAPLSAVEKTALRPVLEAAAAGRPGNGGR